MCDIHSCLLWAAYRTHMIDTPIQSTIPSEDGILVLQLVKAQTGVTWPAAIAGHEVSPDVQTTDQKRLMLERFQAEVRAGWWQASMLCR